MKGASPTSCCRSGTRRSYSRLRTRVASGPCAAGLWTTERLWAGSRWRIRRLRPMGRCPSVCAPMKPSILRSLCCTALGAAFILAPLTTMAETPLEKGEKFLAENKSKEGVKTTASGLQYKILKEGTGKSPAATDRVLVHYEGKTIDGKIFDSSIKRGEPIAFPLNGVIPGWTEGLQL